MSLMINPSAEMLATWARDLSDLSDLQLATGISKAKDFTGRFSLPAFRELCMIKDESNHPMYKQLPKEVYIPADEEKAKSALSKMKSML